MRRLFLMALVALGISGALSGCWGGGGNSAAGSVSQEVAANPDLQTLEEALAAAGLTATLDDSAAQYTLFAPTNAAFDALLIELGLTKDALFADVPLLTAVLKFHVLGAKVVAADVPLGKAIEPIGGGFFKIDNLTAGLTFQDGRNRTGLITQTDVGASNGVIHIIDHVMLPADKDIVATALSVPDFSTLVEALTAASLVTTLQAPNGPYTVFAPTNAAFDALFVELGTTKDALFANVPLLTSVLTYHVLSSRVLAAEVPIAAPITTLEGSTFTVDANLVITDESARTSNITGVDVFTTNGVIHTIDKVLLPVIAP